MIGGYTGRLLRVDLNTGSVQEECQGPEEARTFIGGSGLGARIMMDETGPDTDPLGPDNRLLFLTGPLTGTQAFCSGRHQVVGRSPLTGAWGEASAGGYFGPMLKRAGYDGVIIQGRSDNPVYLWINDGVAQLRSADHLWGHDTYETDLLVRGETSARALVSCIGPAGERQVKLAAIMSEGRHGRAAARTGLGAVMGSKNLKAIAVWGHIHPEVARPADLVKFNRQLLPQIREDTAAMSRFGTGVAVERIEAIGDLPIRNWRQGSWKDGARKLSGVTVIGRFPHRHYHCYMCPIGCGKDLEVGCGDAPGYTTRAPEYETLASLGACTLVDDLDAVIQAADLCNRYGLDTISVGMAVAFAYELFERGLIRRSDTDGLDLRWGDSRTLVRLVELIGRKEGIGALLGQGTREAAQQLGGLASEYAIHVKGLEVAAHDPRARSSLALAYATANRGACHLQGQSSIYEAFARDADLGAPEVLEPFTTDGKAELVRLTQAMGSMYDSLALCRYLRPGVRHIATYVGLVTGWDIGVDEFLLTGIRLYNLKRLFNVRLGLSRKDDTLPPRLATMGLPDSASRGHLPHLGKMLSEYYRLQGWSEEGIPSRDTLERLGLSRFATHLPSNGG